MNRTVGRHVSSFQTESHYRGRRYHWMICCTMKPDELVSWDTPLRKNWRRKQHRTKSKTSLRG